MSITEHATVQCDGYPHGERCEEVLDVDLEPVYVSGRGHHDQIRVAVAKARWFLVYRDEGSESQVFCGTGCLAMWAAAAIDCYVAPIPTIQVGAETSHGVTIAGVTISVPPTRSAWTYNGGQFAPPQDLFPATADHPAAAAETQE